jgi:hypothetical protein
VGYELRFQWTNPSRNVDQSPSTDLDRAFISDGNAVVREVAVSGPGEVQILPLAARDLVGDTREYSIQLQTLRGRLSASSPSVSLTVIEVPGPGSGVTSVVDQNRITLEWETPEDEVRLTDAYRVYRSGVLIPGPPITGTRFEDTSYEEGETFVYTVVPLRQRGTDWVEGLPFESLTVTALDRVPPAPPTNLSLMPFEGGAFIRWQSSLETDVVRYTVLRRDEPGGQFRRVSGSGQVTTAFADPEYEPGYVYAVTALDRSGNESLPSAAVGE